MANQCKFYKVVRQVSYDSGVTWVNIGETQKGDLYEYDSAECGAVTQYRWVDVTGAYTCEGTTKYQKTKKQVSTDGGTTWQDVSPAEYGKGDVIEYYSEDCGGGEYSDQYLTFVALEDVRFKFWSYVDNETGVNRVNYSLDGGSNWASLPNNTYTPMVQSGQKIMWKGTFRHELFPNDGNAHNYMNSFGCTGRYKVEGNIMSLLYGDDFIGKRSLADTYHVFDNLFNGWFDDSGYLVSAENLVLPATTLSHGCYYGMFLNCTSLTTAPVLSATTLAEFCYYLMFGGCSSLNYIKCLATDISANRCTGYWVEGVSSSGTFVKASSASWSTGTSGIPTNWSVQNA